MRSRVPAGRARRGERDPAEVEPWPQPAWCRRIHAVHEPDRAVGGQRHRVHRPPQPQVQASASGVLPATARGTTSRRPSARHCRRTSTSEATPTARTATSSTASTLVDLSCRRSTAVRTGPPTRTSTVPCATQGATPLAGDREQRWTTRFRPARRTRSSTPSGGTRATPTCSGTSRCRSVSRSQVRLYFANRYGGTSEVGQRVFDVSIDSTKVLDNFDIVATAAQTSGARCETFPVTSDGTIDIDVRPRGGEPVDQRHRDRPHRHSASSAEW